MIKLINKTDKTKALLIGENENDHETMQFIFDNNIMWGFHTLIHISDKNKDDMLVKQLLVKYPNITCIAQLNCPEGFVPNYDKKEIK